MTDYVMVSKEQAQSLLVEIAELRTQVTYLTGARDRAFEQRGEDEKQYRELYAEHQDTLSELIQLQAEISALKGQLEAHGVSVE